MPVIFILSFAIELRIASLFLFKIRIYWLFPFIWASIVGIWDCTVLYFMYVS